jgi:hypothetical protein
MAIRHTRCHKIAISLVICAGVGLAAAPYARAEDLPVSDEARMHFKAGVNYLQDPDGSQFENAYTEFKTAYDLSHSPKVLGNMGYCAMKLERDGEAIDAYTNYLKVAPDIAAQERAQIETDLYTLTASATVLAVSLSSARPNLADARLRDTRYSVHGNVSNIYVSSPGVFVLVVRAGHHTIDVTQNGAVRARWEFDAIGGAHLSHTFALQEPVAAVPGGRPSKILPWLTVGVGAAGLATGAVAGLLAVAREHSLEGECPMNICPTSNGASDKAAAYTFGTVADIGLLGGGVLAATGIVWLIASGSGTAPPATTPVASGGGRCTGRGCYGTLQVDF